MSRMTRLTLAVLAPILLLGSLAGWKGWVVSQGMRATLPIQGFDPRDLLSGHYLIYRIEYGIPNLCKAKYLENKTVHACLDSKTFSIGALKPSQCRRAIRGRCESKRFIAGIERFYVPEDRARALEKAVMKRKGSVVLALDGKGSAIVADLLIEGRSWKEWVATTDEHDKRDKQGQQGK